MTQEQIRRKECFLEPEVRDGIPVSSALKKIWQVELDLLEQFIRICKKHNFKWFAVGGTLIGAARHKGFIPWDDDIDVAMPRPDYDKFVACAQMELKHPYFLSTAAIEPQRWHSGIAKIINSQTAAIPLGYIREGRRYNFGIFIDIIPLDGVSDSRIVFAVQRFIFMTCYKFGAFHFVRLKRTGFWRDLKKWVSSFVYGVLGVHGIERLKHMAVTYVRYGSTIRCGALSIGFKERDIWMSDFFDDYVMLDYEYLQVRCPVKFDQLLTMRYGNWRKFDPQDVYHHFAFYPDRPYIDVLISEYGCKREEWS